MSQVARAERDTLAGLNITINQSKVGHMSDTSITDAPIPDPEVPAAEPQAAVAAPETTVPEITKEDRQKAITEAYTEATKILRDNHRKEFLATQMGLLAARGIEWTPAPTKAERAIAAARKALTDAGLSVPAELA